MIPNSYCMPWLYCEISCQVRNLATKFIGIVLLIESYTVPLAFFEMKGRIANVSLDVLSCPRHVSGQRNNGWLFNRSSC